LLIKFVNKNGYIKIFGIQGLSKGRSILSEGLSYVSYDIFENVR